MIRDHVYETTDHTICLYIHTYIHTYIHAYIHTCTHAYIHTCIHAYIHANTNAIVHAFLPPKKPISKVTLHLHHALTFDQLHSAPYAAIYSSQPFQQPMTASTFGMRRARRTDARKHATCKDTLSCTAMPCEKVAATTRAHVMFERFERFERPWEPG